MMYIHYCKYCRRIHILNGHKVYCPACSGKLTELYSYMKYVNLSKTERGQLKEKCADEKGLKELSVEYRMHRYSKWFKNLPAAGSRKQILLLPPLLQIINNHACQNTTHACKFPYRDFFSKERRLKDKHIAKRFNHRPVHERKSSESADIEYGRTQKQHVSANHPGIGVSLSKDLCCFPAAFFKSTWEKDAARTPAKSKR